ncbi:MAG TPA: DNA-processing protein DprA, partial [Thermoguttaceae bacterium]|nr:DNA-processing protein DprA [Thermoguttaceae bacterium]
MSRRDGETAERLSPERSLETDTAPPSEGPSDGDEQAKLFDELALALVRGVGPRTRRKLLDYFGDAAAVLGASVEKLQQVPDVGPKLAAAVQAAQDRREARQVFALCQQQGVKLVLQTDPAYPELLKQIADPPGVLFVRGEVLPRDQIAVAIVGTRHPSLYGLRQAERLAASLARAGVTIISGLARGIDAAAHRGALGAGGRTLAVLANGVLDIYPPE